MNILYLLGALIIVAILGYAYFIFVAARRERGLVKIAGFALSGLLVLVLVLLIVLYRTGAIQTPGFMADRPTERYTRGVSGYVTGMMLEDDRAIDEFIAILKSSPELYEKFKARLK